MPIKAFTSASIRGFKDSSTAILMEPDVGESSFLLLSPPPVEHPTMITATKAMMMYLIILTKNEFNGKNEAYANGLSVLLTRLPWWHFLNHPNGLFVATTTNTFNNPCASDCAGWLNHELNKHRTFSSHTASL